MSDEKPLHVQVAEALGWTEASESARGLHWSNWRGCPPGNPPLSQWGKCVHASHHACGVTIPRYDTDWACAGPLIEKYGIAISQPIQGVPFVDGWAAGAWERRDGGWHYDVTGPTPLIAVCRLILALKAAGKL